MKTAPGGVDVGSILVDYRSSSETCITWDPVLKTERYMVNLSPASSTSERKTKIVVTNRVCFDSLRINTQYQVSLQAFNGVLAGPEVFKSFFQPQMEEPVTAPGAGSNPNSEPAVDINSGDSSSSNSGGSSFGEVNVEDLSEQQQNELVERGREFIRQFVGWHRFQYSQWQEAINRYVPYLESKLEAGQTLKNPDAVCPDKDMAPQRCLRSTTITDHNGCSFVFCLEAELGK